jgi:hypothetical protein
MKTYLHINIKGKMLWCFCAVLILSIVITCCSITVFTINQPDTATVGSTVPISVNFTYHNIYASSTENLVFGFLAPKGWAAAQNAKITYTSTAGNGKMVLMPSTTIEPQSSGLTWSAALLKKFGIGGNLVNDMEWVVYQSDVGFPLSNGEEITATLNISLKVGADNNNTLCKLGYVIAESNDGLHDVDGNIDGGAKYEYYAEQVTPCFMLTGGSGDIVDFCNPQLTSADPPKSLDNDFVTITFDGTVTPTALTGASKVYLCATANTSDGKTYTVCDQSAKTQFTQTVAGSNKYKITIWPRSYFGIADSQTIVNMNYFLTDATGNIKVGYGNTASPFTYTFKCN